MTMNQAKINECLNLIRLGNRKINEIRVGNNESSLHRDRKIEICVDLLKQGKSFVTEAIFKDGGRADIFVLDDFRVIEVVNSESDESIENKKIKYPKGIRIEVLKL